MDSKGFVILYLRMIETLPLLQTRRTGFQSNELRSTNVATKLTLKNYAKNQIILVFYIMRLLIINL